MTTTRNSRKGNRGTYERNEKESTKTSEDGDGYSAQQKKKKAEGPWICARVQDRYDDGGLSGGNLLGKMHGS